MQAPAKEIVKIVVVCLVVMLALPAAYRVWLACHPQPEGPRQTLAEYIGKAAEENALRLLKTPLPKWTEWERQAEPKVCGWLKAHEKTVLPWEWTDEARRKDPEGYLKLWRGLFAEQEAELNVRLKAERRKLKAVEREMRAAEAIHAHRTNQLVRIQAFVATNAFPVTLRIERLEKGRFWGWNTRVETLSIVRREDYDGTGSGFLFRERRLIDEENGRLLAQFALRDDAARRVSAFESCLRRQTETCKALLADPSAEQDRLAKALLDPMAMN